MNETCYRHRASTGAGARRLLRARHGRWLLIACLLAGVTVACSSLARSIVAPEVRLQSLALLEASADRQRFAVRLRIDNPNPLPIPVVGLEFNVRLGGDGLLRGRSAAPFTVPAGGSEIVIVEVDADFVSSVSRLLALVQGPTSALAYEATGVLSLNRPFRSPLAFSARGEVPLSMSGTGG